LKKILYFLAVFNEDVPQDLKSLNSGIIKIPPSFLRIKLIQESLIHLDSPSE